MRLKSETDNLRSPQLSQLPTIKRTFRPIKSPTAHIPLPKRHKSTITRRDFREHHPGITQALQKICYLKIGSEGVTFDV
jgi:hypothetical protein